nr:PREDICTED: myeloid-derived growth factor [Paralichthys olivaceus]
MAAELTCRVVAMTWMFLLVSVSSLVPAAASAERTKTVEFNVKPGGVVHTFTERVVSDINNKYFFFISSRPQGKSYLFFTQFKAELKGTKIEYANAYSQTAGAGQSDVPLRPEEFTIGDSTVTHNDGKFNAQLSKLTAIGRTRHDEL